VTGETRRRRQRRHPLLRAGALQRGSPRLDCRGGLAARTELLSLECANALWKKARVGELTLHDARSALDRIVSGFIELRSSTALAPIALELGAELNHPVYDCVYMALAEAESAAFLTADRKLVDLMLANRPSLRTYWVAQEIPKVLH